VAIIAMLMSILLPSLSKAREQAKKVKCLANMKQIGVACQSYFMEVGDWFPFGKRNQLRLHGFYYGGHPGRQVAGDPHEWWGYVMPNYRDTPAGRPLNQYLYQNLPNYDVPQDDPAFEIVRDLPVFECPSDTGGFWNDQVGGEATSKSNYWFTGSSYTCNYHFAWNWAMTWARITGLDSSPRWLHRSNAFLRVQQQRQAAVFILLFEDPFDSAQYNRVPMRGWHREWNRHSLLFLDGHAANLYTDTTKGNRGLGWKSASGNAWNDPQAWWMDPDDPDYKYREIAPLPGY